jgi:hypothetical protein
MTFNKLGKTWFQKKWQFFKLTKLKYSKVTMLLLCFYFFCRCRSFCQTCTDLQVRTEHHDVDIWQCWHSKANSDLSPAHPWLMVPSVSILDFWSSPDPRVYSHIQQRCTQEEVSSFLQSEKTFLDLQAHGMFLVQRLPLRVDSSPCQKSGHCLLLHLYFIVHLKRTFYLAIWRRISFIFTATQCLA